MKILAIGWVFIVVLLLLSPAFALPDSQTSRSGNNCLKKHSIKYTYSVTAPKTVTVGDTFTVSLDFSLRTESRLNRAPTEATATLGGSNVELITNSMQQCPKSAQWQVKATQAGTANLKFDTSFYINGNDAAHRGYSATFKDAVDFSISVQEPPPEIAPLEPDGPPTNDSPSQGNATEGQNTTRTQTINQTVEQELATNETCDTDETQVVTQTFEGELEPEPEQTSWIITRILGLLAYLFLFLSVLTALLKKAGYERRLTILFKYHHDISLVSLILVLFHGLSSIFDKYMWDLSVSEVFFPRVETGTQIYITLGIISFYVMLLVALTSVKSTTIKKVGFKRWKYIHMTSYISFFFVFIHSILLGTDLATGPLMYLVWGSALVLLIVSIDLLVIHILRGKK